MVFVLLQSPPVWPQDFVGPDLCDLSHKFCLFDNLDLVLYEEPTHKQTIHPLVIVSNPCKTIYIFQ